MWDEITYPFPNFNSAIIEVWEFGNFIPHITLSENDEIKKDDHYWVCDYIFMLRLKLIYVSKRGPICLQRSHLSMTQAMALFCVSTMTKCELNTDLLPLELAGINLN